MKKIFGLWIILALLLTSCSPKIIGATPHRRDRNCGCENIFHVPTDTTQMAQTCDSNLEL